MQFFTLAKLNILVYEKDALLALQTSCMFKLALWVRTLKYQEFVLDTFQ